MFNCYSSVPALQGGWTRETKAVWAFHCGGRCPVVPMTPVSLSVMLRSCSGGISPPHGEGKTTPGKEKRAELRTGSPGMVEKAPQPWGIGYFSSPRLPCGPFPQAGTVPQQGSDSCLSQSSAISPGQTEPIFIAPKAAEPNGLILTLQVKIPETVFHLKTDEKVGHTSCCCSPVNYPDTRHYLGQYKKVSHFWWVL